MQSFGSASPPEPKKSRDVEVLGTKRPSSGWDDSPARSRKAVWERDEQCSAIPHGLRVLWGEFQGPPGESLSWRAPPRPSLRGTRRERRGEACWDTRCVAVCTDRCEDQPGLPASFGKARGASGGVRATAPPAGASDSKNRHLRIAGVGSGGCRKGQRGGAGSWGGGSGREAQIFCSGLGRAGDDDTDEFIFVSERASPHERNRAAREGSVGCLGSERVWIRLFSREIGALFRALSLYPALM